MTYHAAGAMHGVVYFKALDDATYFAANSIVTDVLVPTAKFEIEFLKPVSSGQIRAVGVVTEDDGRLIQATGELYDDQNQLVAQWWATFNAYETGSCPVIWTIYMSHKLGDGLPFHIETMRRQGPNEWDLEAPTNGGLDIRKDVAEEQAIGDVYNRIRIGPVMSAPRCMPRSKPN